MSSLKNKPRRLFVDPGSKSSGWALFEGSELTDSGTVEADQKEDSFHRLSDMYLAYFELGSEIRPDEVHIENFRKNLAIQLHHSVGAISAALACWSPLVAQDCWMSSWQRWHGYSKKKELPANLAGYKISSTDELEAIAIGLWWIARYVD